MSILIMHTAELAKLVAKELTGLTYTTTTRSPLNREEVAKISRGQALQAAYLASFNGQSHCRQSIGYAFNQSLWMMDDIGGMFKVAILPYSLKDCRAVI